MKAASSILSLLLAVVLGTASGLAQGVAADPGAYDAIAPVIMKAGPYRNAAGPVPQFVVLTGDTIFNNGPLVTHPGTGGAPDTSKLNPGENILGFGQSLSSGYRMADDFVVAGGDWQIDSVKFFTYQTGSTTTSTINHINLRIWDGPPGDVGSTVIWGDATTNRLASTRWAHSYRAGTPFGTTRPIMLVVVDIDTLLPGGTYWFDWQIGGTLTSGPWCPPVTVRGDTAEGNGLQYNPTTTSWGPALDTGNPAYPVPVQKALPFIIEGSVVPYAKDIRVASVGLSPAFPPLGSAVTVSAVINNLGTESNPASVSLTYKQGSAPSSGGDGVSQTFAPSWTGNAATVTFSTTYTTTVARSFEVFVRAFYTGDQDASNDINVGTEYALPDTDFVMLALGQINGIPVPFGPDVAKSGLRGGSVELVKRGKGTPASVVGRSVVVRPPPMAPSGLGLSFGDKHFDEPPIALNLTEGIGSIDIQTWVQNLGFESPSYQVDWSVGGVAKPPVVRPAVASLDVDTVDMTGTPAERGTLTTVATATASGEAYPLDNTLQFERTLVYPVPNVRLRYDDGSLTISTNIGFGGGNAITAGVRFTAASAIKLANIDAIYRTEGSTDSIWLHIRAAGTTDSTPGPVLYSKRFGGLNYTTVNNDYFTLPLGDDAPAFAAGSSFWVALTFPDTNITYPMAAQNIPPATAGRSFYSGDSGATWTRLRVGTPTPTERAWMLRVVGVPFAVVSVAPNPGWNLLSNPVTTTQDSVLQLYPESLFPYGFSFAGAAGYQQQYRLLKGVGYWLKFPPSPIPVVLNGERVAAESIAVNQGWNMVGSVSDTVDTASIISSPVGLRTSDWFAYPYVAAPAIIPGYGYWVKASQAGKFYFPAPVHAPARRGTPGTPALGGLNSVTITDAAGLAQTLYFGQDPGGLFPAERYEMPPLPPLEAFDVRFESESGGVLVKTHLPAGEEPGEMTMRLQGTSGAVKVGWKVAAGQRYEIVDGSGGSFLSPALMAGEGSVVVKAGVSRLVIRAAGGVQVPVEFALGQNYPNPFNPTTSIRYALPHASRVAIDVFNLLGQRVASLVDEVREAGYYTAEWNGLGNGGHSLASGVYVYRIDAIPVDGRNGGFRESRKMMLLK